MKEKLIELFDVSTRTLSFEQIVMHIIIALILGLVIYISYYFSHEGMYQALGLAMDILSEDYPGVKIDMQPGYILRCETDDEIFSARVTTTDREEAVKAGLKL